MTSKKKTWNWKTIISLLASVGLLVAIVVFLSREMQAIRAFIQGSGWIGIFISIAVYGLLGVSPIPSEPLTVLMSTVYGQFTAMMVAGFGNLLAAVVEYMIGKRVSNVVNFEERRHAMPFGLGKLPIHSVPFLLAARMIPGYGPKFVSLISGVYRVPVWRYLWTAAIPTFAGAAIFAYGGFEMLDKLVLPLLQRFSAH